jgi:hypothetical protein
MALELFEAPPPRLLFESEVHSDDQFVPDGSSGAI